MFLEEEISARRIGKLVREHDVDVLPGTPAMYAEMSKLPTAKQLQLDKPRYLASGARLAQEVADGFFTEYGVRLLSCYHSTEAATVALEDSGKFPTTVGKPIEGVEIRIEGSERKIASDGDGRVALRLPYGAVKLVALRNSGKSVICGIDEGNSLVQQWKASRALGSFGETDGDAEFADTTLAPSAPLNGCIVDRAGTPIERAFVTVYLGAVTVGTALAGKDGRFALPVDGTDAYDLDVREFLPDDSPEHPRSASVRGVHGGEELKIVLEAKLRIDVRFLNAEDRAPVMTTYVGAKAWHHGEKWPCVEWQGMSAAPGDDRTAVAVPGPGSYDVEISVAGFETERVEGVEVAEGHAAQVDLLLRKKHE
jgi:hypothetical protein